MSGPRKKSRRMPASLAGVLAGVMCAVTSVAAQEQPISDAFVQKTQTPQITTEISVAAQIVMEPGLGPDIVSGSVGAARKLAQSAAEDAAEMPDFFRPYQIVESWEVTHAGKAHLSVLGTQWLFTGGAHGNTDFASIIWRRDGAGDGEEVPVTSFFVDGANPQAPVWAVLADVLLAQWEDEWTSRVGAPFSEDDAVWRDGAAKTLTYKPDGYLVATLLPSDQPDKSAGLTFHYAPYVLGPYAMGVFSFDVPHEVFSPYLTADARDVFGGTVPPVSAAAP